MLLCVVCVPWLLVGLLWVLGQITVSLLCTMRVCWTSVCVCVTLKHVSCLLCVVRLGGFLCGLDRSVHPPVAEWLGVICKVCVYVCGGGMEFVQDGGGSVFCVVGWMWCVSSLI